MAGSLFKQAEKLNPLSTTLDNAETLVSISDWLDTQIPALNAIISGDVYKGIPHGRVTNLFGPSQSGKSLVSAFLQKSAIDKDMEVVIFDTEYDKDGRMERSFGVDTSKVLTMPTDTIEDLIKHFGKMLETVLKEEEYGKYFFVLDSVGFLSSEKEISDAIDKNKVAMDMGLKAKLLKGFFRSIKGKLAVSKCPFLVINHEIENPGQLHPSVFKTQGGGKAIEYISSVMINMGAVKQKQEVTDPFDIVGEMTKKDYSGQKITFFTQKNRCAEPHKEVTCYLNFRSGFDRYSGLDPMLEKLKNLYKKDAQGNVGKGLKWYLKTIEKNEEGEEVEVETELGKLKEWRYNAEVWEKILPELNKVANEQFAYKTHE